MFFNDIETERLILKNISYADRDFMLKQFSDDFINRYLFDMEPMAALSEADDLIGFYLQPEPRGHHRWILTLKDSGEKIGTCGFHCWDRANHTTEIGYDLQKAYCGQGFMTEAVTAILKFSAENMEILKVNAHIYPDNIKSANLAKRLGFKFYGETTVYNFRGKDYTHNIYTLLQNGGSIDK